MGKIVAIGGGEMSKGETAQLDAYLVALAQKAHPKLLFVPTASHDAVGYIRAVETHFGALGCEVSSLCLYDENCGTPEKIRQTVLSADIIYVGGGDTVRMLERWRQVQLDACLTEAYHKGIVLSGVSAGSICWFSFGHSDGDSFVNTGWWDYVRAQGLGLIPAAHCPHYNEPGRESFDQMMETEALPGIALENGAALVELDGKYFVIREQESCKAYLFSHRTGKLQRQEILPGEGLQLS